MKIGIVGLGLIGASLAKAIKLKTAHIVFGCDRDNEINIKAKITRVIDDILSYENMALCDIIFVALYPHDTVEYLSDHAKQINPDTIVLDCCGVKQCVCEKCFEIAKEYGFTFIGAHPMAGIEKFGFESSKPNLFDGASMILTAPYTTPVLQLEKVNTLCTQIGFSNTEMCTPREHDRIIAYTSQLAHVVSSAYVKSSVASEHYGFSAGSYRDMTRVAKLNEKMWTQLLLENRDYLTAELDALIERLSEYSKALHDNDKTTLLQLLKDGRERKEYIDGKENALWK